MRSSKVRLYIRLEGRGVYPDPVVNKKDRSAGLCSRERPCYLPCRGYLLPALCFARQWPSLGVRRSIRREPLSCWRVVNLMLASRKIATVFWGADRSSICNDAYATLLGARPPCSDERSVAYGQVLFQVLRVGIHAARQPRSSIFVGRHRPIQHLLGLFDV